MERAKGFVHNLGEYILEQMAKHEKSLTPDKVTFIAAMCEDYNEICECIEFMSDHKDGSLYRMRHDDMKVHDIHGAMAAHDSSMSGWGDSSGRRRR